MRHDDRNIPTVSFSRIILNELAVRMRNPLESDVQLPCKSFMKKLTRAMRQWGYVHFEPDAPGGLLIDRNTRTTKELRKHTSLPITTFTAAEWKSYQRFLREIRFGYPAVVARGHLLSGRISSDMDGAAWKGTVTRKMWEINDVLDQRKVVI